MQNVDLEYDAITIVAEEYREALKTGQSVLVLLEIRLRMSALREIYSRSLLEEFEQYAKGA